MSASALLLQRRQSRPRLALVLLSLLLLGGSLVHLGLGARWIAPQTVLQALFHYDPRNFDHRIIVDLRLVRLAAALLIAITLGLAGCLRAWMMGIGMEITLIVSLTLVCITLWSAVVSSVIPLTLKRVGIDPAVVSAPFIATLIDGTGLIIYFKIAQYFLGLN